MLSAITYNINVQFLSLIQTLTLFAKQLTFEDTKNNLQRNKSEENLAPPNQLCNKYSRNFLGRKHKRRKRPTQNKPKTIKIMVISSVQSLSRLRLFATPWIAARQACPPPTPGVHSDSRPMSQWCRPAISSSAVPFSSCPQSLLASESFQWVNSLHEVAKVLEFQL